MSMQRSPLAEKPKSRVTRQKPAEQEKGPMEASGSGRALSQEDVSKKTTKKSESEDLRTFIAQEIANLKDEIKLELKTELAKTNEELKKMNFKEEIKKIKEEMMELKLEINSTVTDLSDKLRKETAETLTEQAAVMTKETNVKIKKVVTDLEEKLDPVEQTLNQQTTAIKNLEEIAETSARTAEKLIRENQRLSELLGKITDKCTELEGRQRRQNLRIVGIQEGREANQDPREFTANLLQKVLSLDQKPLLARAHRVMRRQTRHDAPPRQMIIKVQYDYVLEEMMEKIVRSRNLIYEGDKISIYRDYPAEVSRKRNAFNETKRILKEVKNLKYGLRYPATLRVTYNQKQHFFTNPVEALNFAQKTKDQVED